VGGKPNKPVEVGTGGCIRANRSRFGKRKVRLRSQPWQPAEIEAASAFARGNRGIVLRQAEERAQLSTELLRTNQELESFSYSVSHDLRAPFRHIIGFAKMLEKRADSSFDDTSRRYLATITESAHYAGTLVDNLLAFSQMGRSEMRLGIIDMAQLFRGNVRRAASRMRGAKRGVAHRAAANRARRSGDAASGGAKSAFQCGQIHARTRSGCD
jgi:light-regulated signal transduction histidine kinase (bacteriophytochrome)